MGINFRKRIKLGKYANLNVGKSGAGLSFGIPGARISRNSKGKTQVSVGIPGTGLSYTKVLGTKSNKKKTSTAMADNDTSMTFEAYQEALFALSHIHTEAADFIAFDGPSIRYQTREVGPLQIAALEEIENFKPSFLDTLLNRDDDKLEALNNKLMIAIKNDQANREWHTVDPNLQARINKKEPAAFHEFLELTHGFKVFEDDCDDYTLEFDMNVDEVEGLLINVQTNLVENVMSEEISLNQNGSLKIKQLSMSGFNERTYAYVASLTLGFIKEALALLPLETVHINIIDTSTNPNTGLTSNKTIVAGEFIRDLIAKYDFDAINPIDVFSKALVDVKFGVRKGFEEVEPVTVE